MAYATLQDMIDRYASEGLTMLTDRTGAGVPDAAVVGLALDDASQVVDSYIAARYQLPLNPVPDQVGRWCCDIARFFLHKDEAPDAVKTLYSAAIAALKDAQAGRLTLEAAAVDSPTTGGTVLLSGPDRVFRTDRMGGF